MKEIQILVKEKERWKIQYNDEEVWVIRKKIADLRPVIVELSKPLFRIKPLPCIWIEHRKNCLSILYRLPSQYEKLPPSTDCPDEIKRQIQRLYLFEVIMLTRSKKSILHRENYIPTVYSLDYSFNGDVSLPDKIVQKWFDSEDIHRLIRNLSYQGKTFSASLDLFERDLVGIIEKVDRDSVWYASDIINRQIMDIF